MRIYIYHYQVTYNGRDHVFYSPKRLTPTELRNIISEVISLKIKDWNKKEDYLSWWAVQSELASEFNLHHVEFRFTIEM